MSDMPALLRVVASFPEFALEAALLRKAAAQIEALTKDAARWRHWRDHSKCADNSMGEWDLTTITITYPALDGNPSLDDITDHAIKAKEAK